MRILLSLAVITAGIIYKNWVGLLGFLTLYTAFTGNCGLNFKFKGLRSTPDPDKFNALDIEEIKK